MKYCSYEARKVVECLDEYGISLQSTFDIEMDVGKYWNTHIIKIVQGCLDGGDVEKKLEKVSDQGWAYFHKPIESMLKGRGGAHRTEEVQIGEESRGIYHAVANGFLRADFNMKELELLCCEIPPMVGEMNVLSNAIRAAGENRSVYYLAGILRREYQTRQGKIREIQERSAVDETRGWKPDDDFQPIDVVDRRLLERDWADRLNSILIRKGLDSCTKS